jgi:hypothetical protein
LGSKTNTSSEIGKLKISHQVILVCYFISLTDYSTAPPASSIMGDVVVENPVHQVPPHKKQLPSSIPNIDSLEGQGSDGNDEYATWKRLQRHLESVGPEIGDIWWC